jgi:hypothetical protein
LILKKIKIMCSDQQIEKLKGHVLIFSEELRSLIQSFELLFPTAENEELLQKISGTKRARGFSVNRWSLIQECLIGITKLTYDQGSQNPTAGNLIEKILDLQAEGLRQKLKAVFAVPIKPGLVPGRPATKDDLAFREEMERREVEELKQAFEQTHAQRLGVQDLTVEIRRHRQTCICLTFTHEQRNLAKTGNRILSKNINRHYTRTSKLLL